MGVVALRLAAQGLTSPTARMPVEVVGRLLSVQGQDQRGARLAMRARTTGCTAGDVDRALTDDRSLVISWLNRGTLHLVRSEDYAWLHALTTPPLHNDCARRLRQEGVSPEMAERGVAAIERALVVDGPSTRSQLRERLDSAGVTTAGQALVYVLYLATLRGLIVRGPMAGKEQAFVLVRDWLGDSVAVTGTAGRVDRDLALAELARRYLVGHGPASDRDLAKWAGLALQDVRAGLRAIGPETVTRADGLIDLARRDEGESEADGAIALPSPRLLGAFDPVLLGWESRAAFVGAGKGIVTDNGVFRPFALVDGQAVATWTLRNGRVVLEPFAPLEPEVVAALEVEAADVVRFLA